MKKRVRMKPLQVWLLVLSTIIALLPAIPAFQTIYWGHMSVVIWLMIIGYWLLMVFGFIWAFSIKNSNSQLPVSIDKDLKE